MRMKMLMYQSGIGVVFARNMLSIGSPIFKISCFSLVYSKHNNKTIAPYRRKHQKYI